jgi:hypothetical protein
MDPRFGHDFSQLPIHPPAAGAIPPTLTVNEPGDRGEQEADRVAEQVMRAPAPRLPRAWPGGAGRPTGHTAQPVRDHGRVQATRVRPGHTGQTTVPPSVYDVVRSPGQPLDPPTRAFLEPRFGHDFSTVRVHTDPVAARSAGAIAAQAYTVGSDMVFGAGRYAPASRDGQRLLAHELAHVLQQQSGLAVQRQPLVGQRFGTIPTDLVSSANVRGMTDTALADRHDRILAVLD